MTETQRAALLDLLSVSALTEITPQRVQEWQTCAKALLQDRPPVVRPFERKARPVEETTT
jgi:hypothetical protein